MAEIDIAQFVAASDAFKASSNAFENLVRDNRETWERNDWRRHFDAYWNSRGTYAKGNHDPDAIMAELHPDLKSVHDEIDAHSKRFSSERDAALTENAALHRAALGELGRAMVPELIEAVDERRSESLNALLEPIYARGAEIRSTHLDGLGLSDFDPGGAFSLALIGGLAEHLGVDGKRATSLSSVSSAYAAAGRPSAPSR